MAAERDRNQGAQAVGLCANCAHARRIESERGSLFWLCQLSATDSRFAKYPRLPVLNCAGYLPEPGSREGAAAFVERNERNPE
jgi:hypothetical protein